MKIRELLFLVAILISTAAIAQKRPIKGVVRTSAGAPVGGATIMVKGAEGAVSTNNNGEFTVNASTGDELLISNVGFVAQTLKVGAENFIMVTLEASATTMQDVVLVGTRSSGRTKIETPVPVDVVNMSQVSASTGRMDVSSILNFTVPSFNHNRQSGSDGADHIDLASLRGLAPDQTLVLINGKRRHQTAFVAVFGTRGRGNTGTDLSAIPTGAIDRIEVLRDGASAQYGSDAMAGVINIVTKRTTGKLTGNVGWSSYLDGKFNPAVAPEINQYVYDKKMDGTSFNANLNYGMKLGKGFLNLTGNYLGQGKTYRQVTETTESAEDWLPANIYRRAHGDGSLSAAGLFMNMELPSKGRTTFYSFGGVNAKTSDAYAFSRNWSVRPDRFPTNNDGSIIWVPEIMRVSADQDTFYNPRIKTKILDASLAAGAKGKIGEAWNWDLSNTTGYNDFHYFGRRTFNASLGPDVNSFDDGGFNFLQNTVNANFSKPIYTIAEGFNLAMGAEYRYERYKLYPGELNSYKNWDPTGQKAGGAQGFPGYQPSDAVTATRSVIGAYVDAEMDVTKNWLVSGAIRAENYSDFGFTTNYKLATRYKVASNFNLRGSVSTGFRAPSLPQINFSSTFTTVQGGQISEVRIVPNYLDITRKAGIPELKQEKSVNASLGFTYKPIPELSITIDGYYVTVKDRVVLTGQFDAYDPDLNPDLAAELQSKNIALAQFFANAVNTKNIGVDIVLEYAKRWNGKSFRALLTGNVQNMEITKVNVPAELSGSEFLRNSFFSDRERAFVLASAPKMKFAFNAEYGVGRFTAGLRATYFGKVTLLGYGEDGLGIDPKVPLDDNSGVVKDEYIYNGKIPVDLYVGYKLNSRFTISAGSDNIFNVHPDLAFVPGAKGWAYNTETGGAWDAVQMGANGRRLFARLSFSF